MASRADVAATAPIVAVVVTVPIAGKYCSTTGTGSHMVSHILPSGVNLYSFIFSFPLADISPTLLALSGGHSTGSLVLPPAGGGSGVSKSGAGGSSVLTPSSTSSLFGLTVCHVKSL